jgi:hypothetical protein
MRTKLYGTQFRRGWYFGRQNPTQTFAASTTTSTVVLIQSLDHTAPLPSGIPYRGCLSDHAFILPRMMNNMSVRWSVTVVNMGNESVSSRRTLLPLDWPHVGPCRLASVPRLQSLEWATLPCWRNQNPTIFFARRAQEPTAWQQIWHPDG